MSQLVLRFAVSADGLPQSGLLCDAQSMPFRRRSSLRTAVLAAAVLWAEPAAAQPDTLPALGADPNRVSVSGLSSGGFMALQYAVAFSSSTIGVGVVAGGPYNCAYISVGGTAACEKGAPVGADSYKAAAFFAAMGQIDPVERLKSQNVYLFSGTEDNTVRQTVVDAVGKFFSAAGTTHVQYVRSVSAGHAFVSVNFGAACATSAQPYVNECVVDGVPYDQPREILKQIYGDLQQKATNLSSSPRSFDQTEFALAPFAGLSEVGFVYVPTSCTGAGAKCAVHVVFHGCEQGANAVGDAIYNRLGFNESADTNAIIVLYPQIDLSMTLPDPDGCWDWYGYTGSNFQSQSGLQLAAVRAMIRRLIAKP
jgi:poly(3-hydroxybutyrate) depolymerase